MTREDMIAGWARLMAIYSQMPALSAATAKEWLNVLEPFSKADLDAAISMWIANEKYRPVPVALARYCRIAQKKRQQEEQEAEIRLNGVCPWCGGLGYVGQFFEPEDRDRYFYCQCAASPNREKGAEILAAAQADGAWVFDKSAHGFRRRTAWIGDEEARHTPGAAQALLESAGKGIGARI